jgi:aryl-alcohol dehydrogenase-like predicted oxidoreductase
VLGTANLGAAYGITNRREYNLKLAESVMKHALSRGIFTFDTASEYGDAEELIGATINSKNYHEIITKVPARDSYTYEYVSRCLQLSLDKLKLDKVYGLMFHDPEVYKKSEIREISKRLLDSGKIEHLGFSAYAMEALIDAKENNPSWTIFQVPENILDRRLFNSLELAEMARAKNIFYVRSIFLQGLLVSKQTELPKKFQKYTQIFRELHLAAERLGGNSLDLCISYASSISWSSGLIVAANSPAQLDEILDFRFLKTDFDHLETLPEQILDPRRWSELK